MLIDDKLTLLDKLKTEIIDLRNRIQVLESEIAVEICPIKVGDTVTINDNEKTFQGIVEEVGTLYSPYDIIEPTIGNRPTWRATGRRINKGTGKVGKWNFELTGNRWSLQDGVWVKKKGQFSELFNT
ncbi:hypothetical protein WYI_23560 [Ochrobactrum sp. CDB2]|nr:hypothetical protein WYI_23560 [Ochrobactrum sp. CDB2]